MPGQRGRPRGLLKAQMICSNCGFRGHDARVCDFPRIVAPEGMNYQQARHFRLKVIGRSTHDASKPIRVKCTNCLEIGHSAQNCPKPLLGITGKERIKANGMCLDCKRRPPQPGKYRCASCLKIKRKTLLRCTSCRELGHRMFECPNPVIPYDRTLTRERNRQLAMNANGLCACGDPLDATSKTFCPRHLSEKASKAKQKYDATHVRVLKCGICLATDHTAPTCPDRFKIRGED